MEDVQGADISWMAAKDKSAKTQPTSPASSKSTHTPSPQPRQPLGSPLPATTTTATSTTTATPSRSKPLGRSNSVHGSPSSNSNTNGNTPTSPRPIPSLRSGLSRSNSVDRVSASSSVSPQRRPSWLSNISSKFSPASNSPPAAYYADGNQPAQGTPPKSTPPRNAVLPQAVRHGSGDAPYTPAPPRSNASNNILGIFRRLSSSAAGLAQGSVRGGNHGLVERRVLNVDDARERCKIAELNQAKLRRVAFCVDVEIAPQPRYADEAATANKKKKADDKRAEVSAEANADAEKDGAAAATKPVMDGPPNGASPLEASPLADASGKDGKHAAAGAKEVDSARKKKDKKKKSEEERKARKEKKRKMAEANGTVPMEIHRTSSESSLDAGPSADGHVHKVTHLPTTNPVRIYRRCCQLRETPILKKITEQLSDSSNYQAETGIVERLDLSGYWMQLPDLVTLGDYLAVVPIKEVLLEGCGLTDEGLRVVLAGLLAAKRPDAKRRRYANYADQSSPGGVIERLILKNNKLGPEGWKHICLFIYLCRSVKFLDLSGIAFPHPKPASPKQQQNGATAAPAENPALGPRDISHLLSRSLGERLASSDLELLNLGETSPSAEQLGVIVDGAIRCGLRRLGLARNGIDADGVRHVARFLEGLKCEGLDLGGNDLRDHMETMAGAISDEGHRLWALSLADCNLTAASICKFMPALAKLKGFRFIDLSHNQELFKGDSKAVQTLRRYLPKMEVLKRIHLADVSMTSGQAIALAEILPEIPQLAHITISDNPDLAKLADAHTEEAREEACALYASLLAAARVSKTIVSLDVEVPTEESGEVVKALAKQVVAYCLRNMERVQVGDPLDDGSATAAAAAAAADAVIPYPDVLAHLVGREGPGHEDAEDLDPSVESPDEDYVIGGTGVVKALACCLENRGDDGLDSRRPSLDGGVTSGASTPGGGTARLPPSGRARDMSKHLLASARKIRARLQPALARAKENSQGGGDEDLRKLAFLDHTLSGIIDRFEDEFPETREPVPGTTMLQVHVEGPEREPETERPERGEDGGQMLSDGEDDDPDVHIRPVSRLSSNLSTHTKPLDLEEGRMHRRGHQFRRSIVSHMSSRHNSPSPGPSSPTSSIGPSLTSPPLSPSSPALSPPAAVGALMAETTPERYYDEVLLASLDEMAGDEKHLRMLEEMLDDIGDEHLLASVRDKGVLRTFKEERDRVVERMRDVDPEHWERFMESQVKARENILVGGRGWKVGDGEGEAKGESAVE